MRLFSSNRYQWLGAGALALLLVGCNLPQSPQYVQRYDLGVAPRAVSVPTEVTAIALEGIEVPTVGSTDLHYRLNYADAQVLHAYTQARWAQPPAQLVLQRLREHLAQGGRVVLSAQQGKIPPLVKGQQVPVLRLALEEFSQVFKTPQDSEAWVRVRATLIQPAALGEVLLAQQVFEVRGPAPQPNAAGGVEALAQGMDQLGQQMLPWLHTVLSAPR